MYLRTPFHPRLEALNQTLLWEDWAGYASASQYQYSLPTEYFAMRNGTGLFDTSPLFKYVFKGADATRFLADVLTRDIRPCAVGQSQYTIWCNEAGFVIEDGVILRVAEDEYWLTSAEPNLKYFSDLTDGYELTITDISDQYGILALQGPHSGDVLAGLTKAAGKLNYFDVCETTVAKKKVLLSRTGFTGDLGFELWIQNADCLAVWDALMEAGAGYNIMPVGLTAVSMARIDAGLLMIDVDFSSARYAWVDAQRETPHELSLGWMLKNLKKDDRRFIGREAIENEIQTKRSRWKTVGIALDPQTYEEIHNRKGIIAPKAGVFYQDTLYLYDDDFNQNLKSQYVGYVTSFMFSPLMKKHIAIAKIAPSHSKRGSRVFVELEVLHKSDYFPAEVVRMPFYNPTRKSAPAGPAK